MSILLLAAAAAAASAPVHTVSYEDAGRTYAVEYIAHVDASSRLDHVHPASRHGLRHCVTQGKVTVERRITQAGTPAAMSTMLPGTTAISDTATGRCGSFAARQAEMMEAQAPAIQAHLVEVASADTPRVAATIKAARSLAAR